MSKESNDVADLRRFAVLLSDELEIVSKEVVRLMHCLDAYQMVLAGLCVAHRDQQTVLREVENQIEQVAQIPATKPVARDRYLGQLMEHVTPLVAALGRSDYPQSGGATAASPPTTAPKPSR
ncbi:hypothetical protein WR30_26180 [Burkholderia contaminans FFH2055]|uniref:hypothetical protein n=1 Tax=Burkholderia contaminans TaxID=488447 RepID=UPI00062695C6|nr:hypothetical protein [Burkholderia contaminans]KKL34024.1 hypothetical protein WR30_26180 [Burkholderia contaminans FFH2055]MEB4632214.1 hypothetical protein [Burkholderia contaminans]MEB4639637.1 hypothetical protein [Burkholderia contaminans]MEB4654293.1 hypothetical protein [Burkholderia contaminans]MEB4663418.1 hypothetical protein [Burkholderia contaminans]